MRQTSQAPDNQSTSLYPAGRQPVEIPGEDLDNDDVVSETNDDF